MGLFSTEKKIFVSTVVYNLAGDEKERPDYLKTTVIGGIMSPTGASLGETLTRSYLNGPGIRLRSYGRWAHQSNYAEQLGLNPGSLVLAGTINQADLIAQIPHEPDQGVMLQFAEIGGPDYTYWVDRYMVEHHPDLLDTAYVAQFDETTKVISITLADTTVESFSASDYDPRGEYLYTTYNLTSGEQPGPVVLGTPVALSSSEPFPSTAGWIQLDATSWEKVTRNGSNSGGQITATRQIMTRITAGNGDRSYRIDTQEIVLQSVSPLQMLIYRQGSGNPAMDALFTVSTSTGNFLPFVPIRINNRFVSPTYLSELYLPAKKALKKATNAKFDDLVDKIAQNSSLGDIDYAYAVFGVALNTKENACRRYIYEFFQEIMRGYEMSGASYRAWKLDWAAARQRTLELQGWWEGQGDPESPYYLTPEPPAPSYPAPPSFWFGHTSSSNATINYNMSIGWSGIEETAGFGKKKPDAKPGEFWFEVLDPDTFLWEAFAGPSMEYPTTSWDLAHIRLNWQVDANSWRCLDIHGLRHSNMIYGGNRVEVSATEALAEEDESGFIIPLHEDIFRRMSLVDATQMGTACCFLVFNCYKVVKLKWYQSSWFKVILFIVIIVITIITGGGGSGLLGVNAAVGASMGYTGAAAAIAGAIANAIAAMIVTQIIMYASTALFGAKVGAIIGTILSFVTLQVGTALASTGSLATSFSSLTQAENILRLTIAAGDGYAAYIKGDTQDVLKRTQDQIADYTQQSQGIATKYDEILGQGPKVIDPLMLTEATHTVFMESPDSFLSRTLMTGSDVADMSLDMLTNFTKMTLSTELTS